MSDATAPVRGILKIDIGEQALALTLSFSAGDDGDEWTVDRLTRALAERRVTAPPPENELAAFLAAGVKAVDEPHTAVLLKGVAPQPPSADTVAWNDELVMPSDLEPVAADVIASAPAPEIVRDVKETVEKTREVAAKGRIPFGQSKPVIETYSETVTRKEKVYVDPEVGSVLWAEDGALIGTVTARSLGIPGRDIFGRTIPAKQIADPAFHLGANVTRQGDRLIAAATGFVRVGSNWADIVPFARHEWRVELSADRATCYLIVRPGHPASPRPDLSEIREAAIGLPYNDESLLENDEIEEMVTQALSAETEQRLTMSVSRDGSFDIAISDDKLVALLNIHKGKGRGSPVSLKSIGAAIKESGLRGLEFKKISADIMEFHQGPEFDLTGYLLAEGRAATLGPEREVQYAVKFLPAEKTEQTKARLTAHLAEHEDPDYPSFEPFPPAAIGRTAIVEADQRVCTVDPPIPGEDGLDVYGHVIKGGTGPGAEFVLHENLVETNHVIAATAAGVLDYGELDGAIHLRVRRQADARIDVAVADDGSAARITLYEGAGAGVRLSDELVAQALKGAGVVYGIDGERVSAAVRAAQAGTDVENLEVATWTPPIDQNEHQVEWEIELDPASHVRIRKDGTADYRSRDSIRTVAAGDVLCRVLPAEQQPVDGTDVRGKALAASHTTGSAIELGERVTSETLEDGTVVIKAEAEGEILFAKNRLSVLASHTVKGDVDMSVGNIKFPGTVNIGGSVRSGFYVMSTGDIKIAGTVDGALLSADGDIFVKQGVKGAGKAVLRAKKTIMSPYVELATLMAVGNITLKTAVVRSRIKCNGRVTFQGDKGRVVGGIIRARDGVEATSLGSERGARTHVSFGQDYLIADLIEKEEREIEKVKRRITQIDLDMRKAEKSGAAGGAEATSRLQVLRDEKVNLLKLMQKRGLRLFTLRERFEQHYPSKVVVSGPVYGGTVFESHGRTYEVTGTRKGIVVEFNPQTGNIDVSDYTKES